jgi:hypothetical protein
MDLFASTGKRDCPASGPGEEGENAWKTGRPEGLFNYRSTTNHAEKSSTFLLPSMASSVLLQKLRLSRLHQP